MPKPRVALLGDSIIDNKSYVAPDELGVPEQLAAHLPDWDIEMRATDGATTAEVLQFQTRGLAEADGIVLSTGGNDALAHIEVLDKDIGATSREVLVRLRSIRQSFQQTYNALLRRLRDQNPNILALTIYNPKFSAHGMEMEDELAAESALSIFNDVIQQTALSHSCEVLDIRPLFSDGADFANPIEPSAIGGEKLAAAMAERVKRQARP